jgi:fermentation-respiration switch protein FrsA (DUF1100 family)
VSRKKKIILSGFACLAVVLIGVLIWGGNYLVTFAIGRSTGLQDIALKQISGAQVPVLFIHGSEDNFVHTDMVYRVYDACPTEKQLLVVEGAGHGNSFNHAPDTYFETVFGFLAAQGLNQKQ